MVGDYFPSWGAVRRGIADNINGGADLILCAGVGPMVLWTVVEVGALGANGDRNVFGFGLVEVQLQCIEKP